jgi:hypothetical protein
MTDPIVRVKSPKARVIGVLSMLATIGAIGIGHVIGREGTSAIMDKMQETRVYSASNIEKVVRDTNAKVKNKMIDEITRFDEIAFDGGRTITYQHTLVGMAMADIHPDFKARIAANANEKSCPTLKQFVDHGYDVYYSYAMPDGSTVSVKLNCTGGNQ